ncbi:MAG: type II secretion system F family protein [Gemmataceae bacterium]
MIVWNRLGTASLIELCRALRYSLASGLTLRDAMRLLAREGTSAIRGVCGRIADSLSAGWSFQEALEKQGSAFPRMFVSLAAVGEESGNLPEVMGELERYYLAQQKFRREFWGGVSWPLVQFTAAVLIIAGLIVILGYIPVQDAQSGPVDALGLGLTGADGAKTFLLAIAGGIAAIVLLSLLARFAMTKLPFLQRVLFRMPMIGPCARAFAMTRLCIALKLMLDTRLSVLKSIQLAFAATDNSAFRSASPVAIAWLKRGNSIHEAFKTTRLFTPAFQSALAVAEESGRIPEMCSIQAEVHEDQARRLLGILTKVASVLIWMLVAGFIILAIYRIFTTVYIGNINKHLDAKIAWVEPNILSPRTGIRCSS